MFSGFSSPLSFLKAAVGTTPAYTLEEDEWICKLLNGTSVSVEDVLSAIPMDALIRSLSNDSLQRIMSRASILQMKEEAKRRSILRRLELDPRLQESPEPRRRGDAAGNKRTADGALRPEEPSGGPMPLSRTPSAVTLVYNETDLGKLRHKFKYTARNKYNTRIETIEAKYEDFESRTWTSEECQTAFLKFAGQFLEDVMASPSEKGRFFVWAVLIAKHCAHMNAKYGGLYESQYAEIQGLIKQYKAWKEASHEDIPKVPLTIQGALVEGGSFSF